MAIIQGNAKKSTAAGGFYPKVINGSLRFNDDDSAYLSWTPDSAGDRKTWTWSAWVKRGNLGSTQGMFHCYDGASSRRSVIQFNSNDTIAWDQGGSGTSGLIDTVAVFRDPSAWYHIVAVADYSNATPADRAKLYVNGVLQTVTTSDNFDDANGLINSTNTHQIGTNNVGGILADLYMAEVHFLNGIAASPDDFGELKNGVWVAKEYEGAYDSAAQITAGTTHGFYLDFQDDTEVEAFNTVLYRGNGVSGHSITGFGFQPDLLVCKERDSAGSVQWTDAVRGVGKRLDSDYAGAEVTSGSQVLSFDSDGFSVNNGGGINESGKSYVAWGWKAGDSNVSNTDGSITSTVRANPDYGFSIVQWEGTGANGSVGHGLNDVPKFIIAKNQDVSANWFVYHDYIGENGYIMLNQTNGADFSNSTVWQNVPPDSDKFYVSTGGMNYYTSTIIAYCWAEKSGYSKFGSYVGSSGDPSVTTGFKPAFVLIKRTDAAGNSWSIWDNTRDTDGDGNLDLPLFPNLSNAEDTSSYTDYVQFTDTGFVVKGNGAFVNGGTSSYEYIYAAFADTREAAFWLDQSGNDNDWQPVNLDHNDTVADSPTDNFATLNPIGVYGGTLSDGNLTHTSTGQWVGAHATIAMSSGKWYAEYTATDAANFMVGIVATDGTNVALLGTANSGYPGKTSDGYGWINNANKINNDSSSSYGSAPSNGDIIMIAFDADNGELYVGKNGTWFNSSNPATNTSPMFSSIPMTSAYYFTVATEYANGTINFGQQPFKYDPPA
jgi:hypothetical protein